MTTEHIDIIAKTYDPEDGDGALQCTRRQNGKFELVIFHKNDDVTLFDLTRAELLHIGRRLQEIAYPSPSAETTKPTREEIAAAEKALGFPPTS